MSPSVEENRQTVAASTVALTTSGTGWAWGNDSHGQLGNGTTERSAAPALVPGLSRIISVAEGNAFRLAANSNGTVWAWGYDYSGELGDSSYQNALSPEKTDRLAGVTAVAAGGDTAMAIAPPQSVSASPGSLTYEGQYTDEQNSSTHQLTVYLPPSEIAGEVAIADIYTACGEKGDPPPGWSTVGHVNDTTGENCGAEWIYDMVIPANEPRAQNFSLPDGQAYGGAIVDFYGEDQNQPIEGFSGTAKTMSTTTYKGTPVFDVAPPYLTAQLLLQPSPALAVP